MKEEVVSSFIANIYMYIYIFKCFFGAFYAFIERTAKDVTGTGGEREENDLQQRAILAESNTVNRTWPLQRGQTWDTALQTKPRSAPYE